MSLAPAAAFKLLLLPLFSTLALASFIVDQVIHEAATCQPLLLQWQGGKAPRTLRIVAPDGTVFENLGSFSTTSFKWTVNLEAGTVVAAQVIDSTGASATSNSFTIQPGSDTDCTSQNQVAATPPSSTSDFKHSTQSSTTANFPTSEPDVPTTSKSIISASVSATATGAVSQSSTTGFTSESGRQLSSSSFSASPLVSLPTVSSSSSRAPSSSAVAAPAVFSGTANRVTSVGIIFAVLVPLTVLAIFGLCFLRKRQCFGQVEAFSALEAQASVPRWFHQPKYHTTTHPSLDTQEAETQRLTLKHATDTTVAAVPLISPPESALTHSSTLDATCASGQGQTAPLTYAGPASYRASSSEPIASSTELQALQSRIRALMEENAVLSNLAHRPVHTPPPAYA